MISQISSYSNRDEHEQRLIVVGICSNCACGYHYLKIPPFVLEKIESSPLREALLMAENPRHATKLKRLSMRHLNKTAKRFVASPVLEVSWQLFKYALEI